VSNIVNGLQAAITARATHPTAPVAASLILCLVRELGEAAAAATLALTLPYLGSIQGLGLASSEVGFPPEDYKGVYTAAGLLGLNKVAHAGQVREGSLGRVSKWVEGSQADHLHNWWNIMEGLGTLEAKKLGRTPEWFLCVWVQGLGLPWMSVAELPLHKHDTRGCLLGGAERDVPADVMVCSLVPCLCYEPRYQVAGYG